MVGMGFKIYGPATERKLYPELFAVREMCTCTLVVLRALVSCVGVVSSSELEMCSGDDSCYYTLCTMHIVF